MRPGRSRGQSASGRPRGRKCRVRRRWDLRPSETPLYTYTYTLLYTCTYTHTRPRSCPPRGTVKVDGEGRGGPAKVPSPATQLRIILYRRKKRPSPGAGGATGIAPCERSFSLRVNPSCKWPSSCSGSNRGPGPGPRPEGGGEPARTRRINQAAALELSPASRKQFRRPRSCACPHRCPPLPLCAEDPEQLWAC